ncbi:UbiA prenyltransferase family [Schizophyllum amplum]|uniref:UbiA prenyltransferase family n=1 Tax=Schizophyllum amplum TaxID=97359 RepID=A0A550CRS7_9AGAR|nr:UbiA prenyltransferase family [Auriculariopsis ampla]
MVVRLAHAAPAAARGAVATLLQSLYTGFLFSRSDIVPILGPALSMSLVLAGPTDFTSFMTGLIWTELHLMAFETKNQIVGLDEDKLAKPHRPIPSGRISPESTQILYVCLVLASFIMSARLGLLTPSVIYFVAIVAYNECSLARHWFFKSVLSAIGYVCYSWGMSVCFDHGRPLSSLSMMALVMTGTIFATTGQAQDFRDREGDAAIGRKTLAILLPQAVGRWSLAALLFVWTSVLVWFWVPPMAFSLMLFALAATATCVFVTDYSQESDRRAYWWYNMWLISCHALPLFHRLRGLAL